MCHAEKGRDRQPSRPGPARAARPWRLGTRREGTFLPPVQGSRRRQPYSCERIHEEVLQRMVAFTMSILVTVVMALGLVLVGKRRPVGTPLTWGEAMVASVYVFFLLFWAYGVVPHLWLAWADNELTWRPDKLVFGPGEILKPQANGGWL